MDWSYQYRWVSLNEDGCVRAEISHPEDSFTLTATVYDDIGQIIAGPLTFEGGNVNGLWEAEEKARKWCELNWTEYLQNKVEPKEEDRFPVRIRIKSSGRNWNIHVGDVIVAKFDDFIQASRFVVDMLQ